MQPRAPRQRVGQGEEQADASRRAAGRREWRQEGWADAVVGLCWLFLPHVAVHGRGDANSFFNSSGESVGVIQATGCHLPHGITFGNSLSSSTLCFQHPPAHPSSTNMLGQRIMPAAEPPREVLTLNEGTGSQSTRGLEQPGVGGSSITCGAFARPLSTQGAVRFVYVWPRFERRSAGAIYSRRCCHPSSAWLGNLFSAKVGRRTV